MRGQSLSVAAITGGSITGTNAPYTLSRSSIAFIWLSTGSIGNNGALSAITALPRVYSEGAYVWLPAGAIAAGVPAAASWYWCIFSSTTAGTIYNSTYTSGTPAVGVQTAFATTGPGAFTGSIAEAAGQTITVPAGAMGANGRIRTRLIIANNNSAGIKTPRLRFSGAAGTVFFTDTLSTTTGVIVEVEISNRGSQSVQEQSWAALFGAASPHTVSSETGAGAIDTSAATTLVISGQRDTATDNLIITYEHQLAYAA